MQQQAGEIKHRLGENGRIPFRSGRMFNVGPMWYYVTREHGDTGPFISKVLAETSLKSYLQDLSSTSH